MLAIVFLEKLYAIYKYKYILKIRLGNKSDFFLLQNLINLIASFI